MVGRLVGGMAGSRVGYGINFLRSAMFVVQAGLTGEAKSYQENMVTKDRVISEIFF